MFTNRIHIVLFSILTSSVLLSCAASTYAIETKQGTETPVEYVDDPPEPQTSLGTKKYEPGNDEKKFFDKLDADEITTGGLAGEYDIRTRDRKFVGWFGIVREIEIDNASDTTRLLVEHKYFDGLTDLHLQAVSFNGSGDFVAIQCDPNAMKHRHKRDCKG